jgi:hypothetical protein
LPALKAAADNLEGTFMSAAAEGDSEDGDEETGRSSVPVMTEAVGPLVTAVAGKARPEAWTRQQVPGPTVRLRVRKKSIPKMTMDTPANKNFQVKR